MCSTNWREEDMMMIESSVEGLLSGKYVPGYIVYINHPGNQHSCEKLISIKDGRLRWCQTLSNKIRAEPSLGNLGKQKFYDQNIERPESRRIHILMDQTLGSTNKTALDKTKLHWSCSAVTSSFYRSGFGEPCCKLHQAGLAVQVRPRPKVSACASLYNHELSDHGRWKLWALRENDSRRTYFNVRGYVSLNVKEEKKWKKRCNDSGCSESDSSWVEQDNGRMKRSLHLRLRRVSTVMTGIGTFDVQTTRKSLIIDLPPPRGGDCFTIHSDG